LITDGVLEVFETAQQAVDRVIAPIRQTAGNCYLFVKWTAEKPGWHISDVRQVAA
jgi:hypothetical protein